MKLTWKALLLMVLLGSALPNHGLAGLFKMDFAVQQNVDELDDWDEFDAWSFFDFDDEETAVWEITDFSGGGDDDVILSIRDQEELADELGAFAQGMIGNNPVPQFEDVTYDGIDVPAEVKDDYLYRDPDTAGTELLFRFENLDPGQYNVTLFLGRTDDNNGQFGKLWVESDADGMGEPDEENTGNFAGFDPDIGEANPEGNPVTFPFTIGAGEYLWYAHMEDNSGGISGIIIRQTETLGPPGDYNGNGERDAEDIDILSQAILAGDSDAKFDLNADGAVNDADRGFWVVDLTNTFFGDSNFDGQFNSSDFVKVFTSAKYETGGPANWEEGDWNGDGQFSSADFVTAFIGAGYETGEREGGLMVVPEPSSIALFFIGLFMVVRRKR